MDDTLIPVLFLSCDSTNTYICILPKNILPGRVYRGPEIGPYSELEILILLGELG